MTILSQSFFTLVGSHLVAFSFLSAGHSKKILVVNNRVEWWGECEEWLQA